jgi:hypothetical protein
MLDPLWGSECRGRAEYETRDDHRYQCHGTGYDQHVKLAHKIPVHITYLTLWVNDDGSISNLADIYDHDARMATALFGDKVGFAYPETPAKPRANPVPSNGRAPWDEAASDDIVGSVVRLLQN